MSPFALAALLALTRPARAVHPPAADCPLVYVDVGGGGGRLCPLNGTTIACGAALFWTPNNRTEDNNMTDRTASLLVDTFPDLLTKNQTPPVNFSHLYPVDEWRSLWFTDEYFQLVSPHWFTFPPPSHRNQYIFAAIYAILTVVSTVGNSLVIFMIFRSLRTPSNLLVANLAVSDFIMLAKGPIFIYNSLHFGPALGIIGCQIYGFMGGLSGTASIMTLAAIALDRYFVISNPLETSLKSTRIVWIVLIWLYSALFSGLPIVGRGLGIKPYVPEGYLTSCSFDYLDWSPPNKTFVLCFFGAAWVTPFCIISLSYVGICRQVLQMGMARRGQEKEKRKRELRLAVVVIFVVAIWFLSWTPYAVVALIGITGNKHLLTPFYSMVPAVFCKTSACVDPFVYSLSHPRMRQELFKLVCRKKYQAARANTQKTIWKTEGSINAKFTRKETYGSAGSINKDIERDSDLVDIEHIKVDVV